MAGEELHYLDLTEVSRRIAARELSAVEVTRAQLDRIGKLDGKLKAYATLMPDSALAEAKAADAEIAAGRHRGPLHGVPVGIKDLCWTQGVATAGGMAIHQGFKPDRDATVVARLRAAGAVILGKLQLTEGAFGVHHPKVPPPVNPWSAAHWTGVSSSGSGVATAAGLCYGSLGSDTGGSIRFPSTMNGLSGLKPTWGRVSRYGVWPLSESLDHIGPMTRSAADAAAMLGVIAGADRDDPTASLAPVPDYLGTLATGIRGLRIGVDRALNAAGADGDMVAACEAAAQVLIGQGGVLREVTLPPLDAVVRDWLPLCAVDAAVAHQATFPAQAAEYGPALAEFLRLGRSAGGMAVAAMHLRRIEFRGRLDALFQSIDLLLLPVMNVAAPSLADLQAAGREPQTIEARLRFTAPLDMSGHPTLTLPGGITAKGMPVGFQIVGRHLDEALILRAGHAFQQATNWHQRRPPV